MNMKISPTEQAKQVRYLRCLKEYHKRRLLAQTLEEIEESRAI